MYIEGKACSLNHLVAALEKYNNRVLTTTRMTPCEASNDKPIPNVIPSNKKSAQISSGRFCKSS